MEYVAWHMPLTNRVDIETPANMKRTWVTAIVSSMYLRNFFAVALCSSAGGGRVRERGERKKLTRDAK